MKPHLKQWRQGMLCGIFAWGLLFLAIFLYFTDSNPAQPAPSSFSFLETRRLLPAQGRQRAIMGASEGLPEGADARRGLPRRHPYGPLHAGPGDLRAWAPDGFENEDDFLSPQTGRTSQSALPPEDAAPGTSGGPEGALSARRARGRLRAETGILRGAGGPGKGSPRPSHRPGLRTHLLQSPRCALTAPSRACTPDDPLMWQEQEGAQGKPHQATSLRGQLQTGVCRMIIVTRSRTKSLSLGSAESPTAGESIDLVGTVTSKVGTHPASGPQLQPGLPSSLLYYSHDAVLRFNSAPTRGYEKDVGNKTTVRIINSQILTNPRHHFIDSSLYKDVILVAWDPAPYSANLHLWYKKPDYNLFTPYVQHRQRNPNQPFYILHPKFIWQLWDIIQENTKEKIQPNPPSSGFLGILLMMSLCGEVHVYEYIPSVRQTDLCHYHEPYYDAACTLGAYHPLLYEKLLVQRLNTGAQGDLHRKGKVVLPGLRAVRCPPGA
ncbi:hypothetical protein DBR06_SOUSAS7210068 [Sousa chinensis]|nr:hypothetical protein DBR06_SOUSAS7210068 [Sousa chinensis]